MTVIALAILAITAIIVGAFVFKKPSAAKHAPSSQDVTSLINKAQLDDLRLEHDQAIAELKPLASKLSGKQLAQVDIVLGSFYMNKHDYKNALATYQEADRAHSTYGTVHAIGDAALQLRDKKTAIAAYKRNLQMIHDGTDRYNSQEAPLLEKTIIELGGSI